MSDLVGTQIVGFLTHRLIYFTEITIINNFRDQLSLLIASTTGHQDDTKHFKTSWKPSKPRPKFYRSNTEPQEDTFEPHHYQGTSGLHNGDTVFENKAKQDDDDNDNDDDDI